MLFGCLCVRLVEDSGGMRTELVSSADPRPSAPSSLCTDFCLFWLVAGSENVFL